MAVTYGFYNSLNHDRVYDALQMSSIFDGIIQNGVFSTIGEALICKASGTGLIVNVGSGRAWFDHTWTLNDTDYPVEAEQAEVVLDRIDAIVLEVNQAVEVRANSIKFVKGTPSSTPVRPTMIHNAEVNQYALAYVSVRAGQTTIFDSDITNVVGTDETPFVTGLLQQLSVEQLLLQWNDDFYRYFNNFKTVSTADFNAFMTTKQTEYAAWYANMQAEGAADLAEFDAWFQHMKDQLDSDAAGHLQAEIDALALQAEKGSIIRVTTPETTLINQTCTITQDLLSRTATFDSHGVADFPSVPMIGDMVITSTDGNMTAIRNVNIPYFGRYEFEIAFWSATLAIHTSSSDLYGRPITIKQGTTTIGTTAFNQQGVASFDVHSAGTYTVSSVTTGGTERTADVVVTEQTTYNVELASTPEGATVTPTDVISTWIACAGLENTHNYTTLAEVMADTELFDTLLRDSNACDYMARSTTWAKAEGLVPVMTGTSTPSGEVIYSSQYTGQEAWRAFDNSDATVASTGTPEVGYFGYHFTSPTICKKVSIMCYGFNANASFTFKIQGSNDGSDWTDLSSTLTFTNGNVDKTTNTFTFSNDTAYSYYKVQYVTASASSGYSQCRMIQFYSADITSDRDAMTRIGLYDYCSEKLLSDATWAEAICNSEYRDSVFDITVPPMTSDTTPSGVASADTNYSGYPAWKAFDGDNTTNWLVPQGAGGNGHWVRYEFPSTVTILCAYIKDGLPTKSYKIQGSNDGFSSDIHDLYEETLSSDTGLDKVVIFSNPAPYKYYRFLSTSDTYYSDGRCSIVTLQFYGRHSSDQYKPLVPVMTSNTTPSGEAFSASAYSASFPAYRAFDDNPSTDAQSDRTAGWYLGYHFPNPVVATKLFIRSRTDLQPIKGFTIEASNDGVEYTILGTDDCGTSVSEKYVEFENTTAYSYYRIKRTASTADYVSVYTLQFYSKIPSTTQIHSCPNDTIYHMANGSPVVLATTDADGVGEVDWGELPAGDLTLYSSVAKDPDNLSNDYHKVCTITKTAYGHTTDFYLMPDPVKTLYWYGHESANLEDTTTANGWSVASGHSFIAPTHNTNYIAVDSTQGNASGVGNKNAIYPTVVHNISECTYHNYGGDTHYTYFESANSKYVSGNATVTNTQKYTIEHLQAQGTGNYLITYMLDARKSNLYAMWYE